MKKYLFTLVLFLILFGGILKLLKFLEQSLIFYPEKLPPEHSFQYDSPFEEITLAMQDGTKINSLYFNSQESKGIILYFHGNAGSLRSWGDVYREFLPNHWDLFITDYRSYGKSDGKPDEDLLYSDALELYEYLVQKYPGKEIIPYGRSIGTAIAAYLANHKKTKRLILETPYTDFPAIAKKYFPFVPGVILSYRLETKKYVDSYGGNTLILHGDRDEIIPVEMGREIGRLSERIRYVEVKGGYHNNLSTFRDTLKARKEFLNLEF